MHQPRCKEGYVSRQPIASSSSSIHPLSQSNASSPDLQSRQEKLLSNAYSIHTANKKINLHEYELVVKLSDNCQDAPPKILSRPYVSRSVRQYLMHNLIPSLIGPNVPICSSIIEPNLNAIYSVCPLQIYKQNSSPSSSQFIFDKRNLTIETDLISPICIDIKIRLSKYYNCQPHNYSSSLLATIIHHQLMMQMMRYGSVYYALADLSRQSHQRLDLISSYLIGISLSSVKKIANNQTVVVVHTSHSYLTHSYRIIDLLTSFIFEKPIDNVELYHRYSGPREILDQYLIPELRAARICDEWLENFESILSGFKCSAINFNGVKHNMRFDVTVKSADEILLDDGTTVTDFYRSSGIVINYPNLPCIKSKMPEHPYYPLEMCSLLSGQKVPIFRLSAAAKAHLTSKFKKGPNITSQTNRQARNEIARLNRDYFETFGLKLGESPVEAVGQRLDKPILKYKDQVIIPSRDSWESGFFYQSIDLLDNWCVVDTIGVDQDLLMSFMRNLTINSDKFGIHISLPVCVNKPKQEIMDQPDNFGDLISHCSRQLSKELKFIMFIIDSKSTLLNRLIHLAFDEHPTVTATCLRHESLLKTHQHRSIFRTLIHKLNARLGGTNHIYHPEIWSGLKLKSSGIMIVGLDVTHPDNELSGVSIVGCAYTYSQNLFKHRSLVWPQEARKELITNMGPLMDRLLSEYWRENGQLPEHIIAYRDGVSNEEFERVRIHEIGNATKIIEKFSKTTKQSKPELSYIIAQKRHTARFHRILPDGKIHNPPGGTLIDKDVVQQEDREFYLYSNVSPLTTARPIHYHILVSGLNMETIQKLTYYLCFNFGRCSSSLSMPSSLRYAHNAAYDARNRVIAAKEFCESKFYTTKFFC